MSYLFLPSFICQLLTFSNHKDDSWCDKQSWNWFYSQARPSKPECIGCAGDEVSYRSSKKATTVKYELVLRKQGKNHSLFLPKSGVPAICFIYFIFVLGSSNFCWGWWCGGYPNGDRVLKNHCLIPCYSLNWSNWAIILERSHMLIFFPENLDEKLLYNLPHSR